jgi:hypothetical protein
MKRSGTKSATVKRTLRALFHLMNTISFIYTANLFGRFGDPESACGFYLLQVGHYAIL